MGACPRLLDLIGGAYQRKSSPRKGRRKELDMAEKKVIKGRGIARKLIEEQNEKMRRLLIKLEAEEAKRAAADAEREQKEIRAAVEEAKEFRGNLERAGTSYTTLLHLVELQESVSDLAHNMLLGYEQGEGWPDGT